MCRSFNGVSVRDGGWRSSDFVIRSPRCCSTNDGVFRDVDWKIFSFDFDKRTLIGSKVVWDDTERGLSRSCCFGWVERLRSSGWVVSVVLTTGAKRLQNYPENACLSMSNLRSGSGLSNTCVASLGSAAARSGTPGIAIRLNNTDVVYWPKYIV